MPGGLLPVLQVVVEPRYAASDEQGVVVRSVAAVVFAAFVCNYRREGVAGYIALNVAIASGAMAVLLPEKEFDMQRDILDKIAETQKTGKRHFIIIVAEGVGHAQEIANEIQARTGIDSRATILGHVQRGGSPTLRDRVNASAMGYHAVCLLEQGKYNRIVGMKGEKLVDYPVDEALEMTKTLDPVLIDVCNTISI